jgi:multidrug resistance efflux pump
MNRNITLSLPNASTPQDTPWNDISIAQRMMRKVRSNRQWLLLIGLSIAAGALWFQLKHQVLLVAHVQNKEFTVGNRHPGTLGRLTVKIGQSVKKGQILGMMDTSLLDIDLRLARTERKRLQSLLRTTTIEYQMKHLSTKARLLSLQHNASSHLTSRVLQLRRWKAELSELKKELAWHTKIRANGLGRVQNLGQLRARQKALRQLISSMPRVLWSYRRKMRNVRRLNASDRTKSKSKRKQKTRSNLLDILQPIHVQLEQQTLRIKQLQLKRKQHLLTAPVDGIVREVLKREGDTLTQGTRVLLLQQRSSRTLIAYARESIARKLRVGMAIRATSQVRHEHPLFDWTDRSPWQTGRIVGVGGFSPLPIRFRTNPKEARWGRFVVIELDNNTKWLPGERMRVEVLPKQALSSSTKRQGKNKP